MAAAESRREIHHELRKPPWERTDVYRNPSMRMGRPDLPYVEAELEGILRLIGTLPKLNPWWPGRGNLMEAAYEVRALLGPRIAIVTLGARDLFIEDFLWGRGADLRCGYLCLSHPDEASWNVVEDRRLLFEGECARRRLSRAVLRAGQEALASAISKHWLYAPELTDR